MALNLLVNVYTTAMPKTQNEDEQNENYNRKTKKDE
jgi:hypothetical protein